jgi:hypothetical protein
MEMTTLLRSADDVLRGRIDAKPARRQGRTLLLFAAMVLLFGMFYGGVMGSFAGREGPRFLQIVYSAVKVPILLLVTFVIALPSFFVLNTLMGVRGDFARVLRALVSSQAGLTVVLAALAPLTAVWYLSVAKYQLAILFNALLFGIASMAAQFMLRRAYRDLIARDAKHRVLLRTWLILFAFVGIQMGWVLRPFIGSPGRPTQFFRQGAWGNAYVELVRITWQGVTRSHR